MLAESKISILNSVTRKILGAATSLSDNLFGAALETCARRLGQELHLPRYFVQQLLAIEDKRFVYHPGVDPLSVLRALIFNVGTAARRPHGASTITQQIYSNTIRRKGGYRPTMGFKIAQSAWAIQRTWTTSKSCVLRDYLDSVYFGRSYYGLSRAARGYCGRDPYELTIADSFFLVERIARPNTVSVARVAVLAARKPIAAVFNAHVGALAELALLYERHFECGEAIATCLERSLRRQVAPTCTSLAVASSER